MEFPLIRLCPFVAFIAFSIWITELSKAEQTQKELEREFHILFTTNAMADERKAILTKMNEMGQDKKNFNCDRLGEKVYKKTGPFIGSTTKWIDVELPALADKHQFLKITKGRTLAPLVRSEAPQIKCRMDVQVNTSQLAQFIAARTDFYFVAAPPNNHQEEEMYVLEHCKNETNKSRENLFLLKKQVISKMKYAES